ncbi:MAG: histidine phosphatase family protein [Pseudomonadota bacterium]
MASDNDAAQEKTGLIRRLVLMRHAKSDWSISGGDHARPLNLRGRLAAPLMGAWLAEQPWSVDLAVVSSAVRTQETWARLSPALLAQSGRAPAMRTAPDLYEAEPDAIEAVIRKSPQDARTVLLLGHNPGIETYAARLAGAGLRFPTAAIAVFQLDAPAWTDAQPGRLRLEAFEQPKSLI